MAPLYGSTPTPTPAPTPTPTPAPTPIPTPAPTQAPVHTQSSLQSSIDAWFAANPNATQQQVAAAAQQYGLSYDPMTGKLSYGTLSYTSPKSQQIAQLAQIPALPEAKSGDLVEYLYPQTWTNLTDTAANYAAGFPSWLNTTYQNWYNQPLSTGVTPELQSAFNTMSSQPSQQWIQGVQGAQQTAQGAQPYFQQAAGALSPWQTTIGSGLSTLGQTVGAVNPYMGAADVLQQQAQDYTGQIGGGQIGVQTGMQTLAGATPYLQQAASQFTQGAQYDPNQLQQYLNPYTQNAAQATVSELNRNLTENLMPGINTTFTGAGQFGSSRNQEFASRALRDTQEAAAKALAQANYGAYNQAQQAYSDWANKQMASGQGLAGLAGQQTGLGQAYGQLGGQQAQIAQQQVVAALQNAGLDQNQAQLIAQMYPQLASGYAQLGSQYGSLAGAYGTLGTQQAGLGSTLANIAGQGASLTQADVTNQLAAAQAKQQLQQTSLDKAYEDWLTQQKFPLSGLGALSGAVGSMAAGTKPNVLNPISRPDDVSRVLAAIQAASSGLSDSSVQNVIDYLFGNSSGGFNF